MIDYDFKYKLEKPALLKFDIEASCCDGVYREIPQPTNQKHKITKI